MTRRDRLRAACGWLLVGLVVAAPLAIGTVNPVTRVVVFTGCALLLGMTLVERLRTGKRLPITIPMLALTVAFLATAAQLVPLPAWLVAKLSPPAHELFSTVLGDYKSHALSLDPPATWMELAKIGAYLAFFAGAVTYVSRTNRRRQIVFAVAIVSTAIAVIGFAQTLVGTHKILFAYTPHQEIANEILVRGTFVNPNHFGALMCLGAPCALAIGMREPRWRVPAFAAVIVLNVGVVLSLSRAAFVAAPIAQLITFGADRLNLRRGGEKRSSGARAAAAIAVVAALAIGISLAAPRVAENVSATRETELSHPLANPHSKFYVWNGAATLAMRYPWAGVGRGAFEQAYTQVSEHGGEVRYQWVENGYLQALVDWGAPVALLLAVLAGWALIVAMKRLEPDPLAAGALGAIVALAVHDAADFSVEVPGIALPALALLATLYARRSSEPEVGRRVIRTQWAFLAAPVVILAVVFIAAPKKLAIDEGRTYAVRAAGDAMTPTAAIQAAEALGERHPADWYVPLAAGQRLARAADPQAMHWLGLAMYLNPSHPTPHLVAAELLARAGKKSQSLLEYRTAILNTIEPVPIWERVAVRWPHADDLIAATPEDAHKLFLLGYWLRVNEKRPRDAEQAYEKVMEFAPKDPDTLRALVDLAIEDRDDDKAKARIGALVAIDSSSPVRRLEADEKLLEADVEGAAKLADGLERTHDAFELELRIAVAYADSGAIDKGIARLDRLNWELTREEQIQLHQTRATLMQRAGNDFQYKFEMEQVARLSKP